MKKILLLTFFILILASCSKNTTKDLLLVEKNEPSFNEIIENGTLSKTHYTNNLLKNMYINFEKCFLYQDDEFTYSTFIQKFSTTNRKLIFGLSAYEKPLKQYENPKILFFIESLKSDNNTIYLDNLKTELDKIMINYTSEQNWKYIGGEKFDVITLIDQDTPHTRYRSIYTNIYKNKVLIIVSEYHFKAEKDILYEVINKISFSE